MNIRKDDTVLIIAGKDRGQKGKIRQYIPKEKRVVVEGVNIVKRHTRPRGQARQAGIIESEASIDISNVMLLCPKCNHPTRISSRKLEDGNRVRECCQCHEVID
jgi:large subunit ribosomal protein L24